MQSHREVKGPLEIAYYERSEAEAGGYLVACFDPTKACKVEVTVFGSRSWPTFDFELPRQSHEFTKFMHFCDLVYERGVLDHKIKIRDLFNDLVGMGDSKR